MENEEKEITPAETPAEETPKAETPSEDLQAQLTVEKAERERFENLYKDSQRKESRIADRERKLDVLDTIPALAQRLDSIEEYNAMQADYLEEIRGTQGIEPPQRRSHLDDLKQRRAEKPKETKPEVKQDPEELKAAVLAQGIIEEMGWDM